MSAPVSQPGVERVVLVDEQDRELGTLEKLAAHRNGGRLHRAFSVFLFDDHGRTLLQRRAAAKYHFPRRWTNACCGHPRPGEAVRAAAERRVREELGVDVTLRPAFTFLYHAVDAETGLAERELDHVLVGRLQAEPRPTPEEVEAVAWHDPAEVLRQAMEAPSRYTPWLPEALAQLLRLGLLEGVRDWID